MFKDKMTIKNGFTDGILDSKSEKTYIGKDRRIKLSNGIDLYNYVERECENRCNIKPNFNIEDEPHCYGCECIVANFYNFTYKLAMLENLIKKDKQ